MYNVNNINEHQLVNYFIIQVDIKEGYIYTFS